jgi:gliding motility-associated-like protein
VKHFYPCFIAIILLLHASVLFAGANDKLSEVFIENRGQVKSEKGLPVNDVLFYKAGQMQVFVTTSGFSIIVKQHDKSATIYNKTDFKFEKASIKRDQVKFINDKSVKINIYRGTDVALPQINCSKTVLIKDIYPGIDWLWSIDKNGAVKHDFMVNIGADASVIQYTVEGADIDNSGGDILKYVHKNFRVKEGPVVFQTREKDLPGKINIQANHVSFQLSDELKKGGFTIDPPLQLDWSNGIDTLKTAFRSIVSDAFLNTFTTGYSGDYSLPVFPQLNGSYTTLDVQDQDVVIMKTDPDQNLVWATFFGGSNNDQGNAIAVCPTGIFVTGYSESWNFPLATAGDYNKPVSLSGRDAFIAKFSDDGIWLWSTGYGGSGTDEALDIKYYNGHIYVGGYTTSHNFPTQQKGSAYFYQDSSITRSDAFILDFDTACKRQWATCFGGSGEDYFSSLFVDNTGIYATGFSDSITGASIPLQSFGSAYYQDTFRNAESFIVRFTPAEALQWSTYFGGSGDDYSNCILRNSCGVFLCGKTTGIGLPVQSQGNGNFYQSTYGGGGSDGFILKLDANTLQKTYCSYYGSAGEDVLTKLASDSACNTIYTGFSDADTIPDLLPSPYFYTNSVNAGGYDAVMLGLTAGQQTFWSTFFGTFGEDLGYGVNFVIPYVVDMVGEGMYNYGLFRIGGTYTNKASFDGYPLVTCNGESNRFINVDSVNGIPGGGGLPTCNGCLPLQFQALIPTRNTCPNQCNGVAHIDTANMSGCLPYSYLWSDNTQGMSSNTLCENYWNQVSDAGGESRTIYGRFDILRVLPDSTLSVTCNQIPDWATLVLPQGGGPPYNIVDRGTTGNQCPNTEYFEITDTAQCVVSYMVDWKVLNSTLTASLSFTPDCQLVASTDVGQNANCVDLSVSGGWTWVTWSGTDTTVTAFSGNSTPQTLFAGVPGHSYTGYLNEGGCSTPLNSVYDFAPLSKTVTTKNPCFGNDGEIKISIKPDTAAISALGRYIVYYQVFGAELTNGSVSFNSNQTQFIDLTGLSGGNYSIVVYIKNSCDSLIVQSTLTQTDFTFNAPTVYCGEQTELIATIKGAVPPLTYIWTGGSSNTDSLLVMQAGNYALEIIDSTGCSVSHSIAVPGSDSLQITIDENLDPCSNTLLSNANVSVLGGTAAYSYMWSNGQIGSGATGLPPGTDGLTVTDYFGCTDSVSFQNTKQLPMIVTPNYSNIQCYGQNNGSINLSIVNGYTPYNVEWSDGLTGQSRTQLSAGTYRYTVTDNKSCTSVGSIQITSPDSIYYTVNTTPSRCSANNGTADLVVSGGTAPLTVLWSNGDTTFSPANLPSGIVNFTISDQNSCSVSDFVNVEATDPLTGSNYSSSVTCTGNDSDGTAAATVFNAIPPVTFLWSTGSQAPFVYNLPAGTYSVTVTDSTGCTYIASILIDTPLIPMLELDTGFGIPCNGQTAYVNVDIFGGTPPYTTSGGIPGYLPSGSYSFSVTDSAQCAASITFSLTDPPQLVTNTSVINLPSCSDPEGSVLEVTSGGTPPYSVYIGNLQEGRYTDSLLITNIPGGTDSLNVYDFNGCELTQSIGINPYITIQANESATMPLCYGSSNGSVTINVTRGAGPFTVLSQSFDSTVVITGLTAGLYAFGISDARGCTDTVQELVTQPSRISGSFHVDTSGACYSDTAYVSFYAFGGTPPYTDTGTFAFLPGNYYQVLSDSNGCNDSIYFTIDSVQPLNADTFISQPHCANQLGSFSLVASSPAGGPYTLTSDSAFSYNFQDSVTLSLMPGNYMYHLFNQRGCELDYAVSIIAPVVLQASAVTTRPLCYADSNGSVAISVTQGIGPFMLASQTFDSTTLISNLYAGNYIYVVSDVFGCTDSVTAYVSQPSQLNGNYIIDTNGRCFTDTALLTFYAYGGTPPYADTGTYAYAPGTYSYTLIDSNGCKDSVFFTIDSVPVLQADTFIGQPDCGNGLGSFRLIALSAAGGPYTLTSDSSVLYVFQDSVTLHLLAGSYNYHLYNIKGCELSYSFTINSSPSIEGTSRQKNEPCYGDDSGSVTIAMQLGSPPYLVNGNSFRDSITFSGLAAGTYTYNVVDVNGCTAIFGALISQPATLILDTSYLVHGVTCRGLSDGLVSFQILGGTPAYQYALEVAPGDTERQISNSFGNLAAGSYTVLIDDANNCSVSMPVTVPPFTASSDSVAADSATCFGSANGSIAVFASPANRNPYVYSLNGAASQASNTFNNLPAGTYQVIVSDANNCMDTINVSIGQPDSIDSRVWLNGVLLPQDSVILTNRDYALFTKMNSNLWSVNFSPSVQYNVYTDTSVQVQTQQDLSYTVTVYEDSSDKNCFIQYSGLLVVLDIPGLPNTITPNGDGFNDVWKIDLLEYPNADVTIFDLWGEIVFASTNYNNDWGGIDQKTGKHLPDGTYFYLLKLPTANNAIIKGDINIVDASH